jgi:hypothetical protein
MENGTFRERERERRHTHTEREKRQVGCYTTHIDTDRMTHTRQSGHTDREREEAHTYREREETGGLLHNTHRHRPHDTQRRTMR